MEELPRFPGYPATGRPVARAVRHKAWARGAQFAMSLFTFIAALRADGARHRQRPLVASDEEFFVDPFNVFWSR